jgi:exosortase/archaeosortase
MRRLKVMMLLYIYISRPSTENYFYCRNITSEVKAVAALYVDFAAMTVACFMYINTTLHRLILHNVLWHTVSLFFNE